MANYVRNGLFLLLSAFAVYSLWMFGDKNGTFSFATEAATHNRLPRSNMTYPTEFTRIARLDRFLRGLVTFFWPMVSGTMPGSSLMCFYFTGQGTAAWILSILEGMRMQNSTRWKMVSFTTTFGILFQSLGIAIVAPLFLIFAPSADSWPGISFNNKTNELLAVIPSIFTGFLVPTVLMSLHAPTVLTTKQKVDAIRLWQFFPLLCYISMWIWTPIVNLFTSAEEGSPKRKLQTQRNALRRVYTFGLYCALVPHVGTLCISFVATTFPQLFADGVPAMLHPRNLFVPELPTSNVQVESLAQGAHWFFQWDMIIMSCTFLVWTLPARIHVEKASSSSRKLWLVLRGLGYSALVGPTGAALVMMWERDEIVFEDTVDQLAVNKAGRSSLK